MMDARSGGCARRVPRGLCRNQFLQHESPFVTRPPTCVAQYTAFLVLLSRPLKMLTTNIRTKTPKAISGSHVDCSLMDEVKKLGSIGSPELCFASLGSALDREAHRPRTQTRAMAARGDIAGGS